MNIFKIHFMNREDRVEFRGVQLGPFIQHCDPDLTIGSLCFNFPTRTYLEKLKRLISTDYWLLENVPCMHFEFLGRKMLEKQIMKYKSMERKVYS